MDISKKVANEYSNEREYAERDGVSRYAVSGYAYFAAKQLAEQEGGKANYLYSPNEWDYHTIIYTFQTAAAAT